MWLIFVSVHPHTKYTTQRRKNCHRSPWWSLQHGDNDTRYEYTVCLPQRHRPKWSVLPAIFRTKTYSFPVTIGRHPMLREFVRVNTLPFFARPTYLFSGRGSGLTRVAVWVGWGSFLCRKRPLWTLLEWIWLVDKTISSQCYGVGIRMPAPLLVLFKLTISFHQQASRVSSVSGV